MNEKIMSLIRLQELDTQLEGLRQDKVRLQEEREKRRGDVQLLQTKHDDSKKSLTEAQVEKKTLEMDVDGQEQAVRKSTGELNSVKSNEAYKALLTQIEEAKKSKSQLEDRLLELMEKIDQLQKEMKEDDKRFQNEKAEVEKQIQDSEAAEKKLEEEIEKKRAARNEFHLSLPEGVRLAYDRVRQGPKGGPAVVPITGQICGGCRMSLPPTVLNEVMKGQELVSCETCTRILYIPAAPVEPAEQTVS